MAGVLKFLTLLMVIAILISIAMRLEVNLDLISFAKDLIFFGKVNLGTALFLVLSVLVVGGLLGRINDWAGSSADPLKPQKIELFTKETPAQIVRAANEALMNIIFVFIAVTVIFFIVASPISILSNLDFLPGNLGDRISRFIDRFASTETALSTPNPSVPPTAVVFAKNTFPFYSTLTPASLTASSLIPTDTPTPPPNTPTPTPPPGFNASTPTSPVNVTPAAVATL